MFIDAANGMTTTTSATGTTILTYPVPANTSVALQIMVCARNTTSNKGAAAIFTVGAQNAGGSVTVNGFGTLLGFLAGSDLSMSTLGVSFAGSGSNVIATGTGLASTTISWNAYAINVLQA